MKSIISWSLSLLLFAIVFACSKEYIASSEKELLSFSVGDFKSNAEGNVDKAAKTVTLQAIAGADITKLVPIIKISDKAKISPTSGVAQDFTNPVTYTVTAEDGSKQEYIVTVLPPKSSEKTITSFNFSGLKPEVVGSVDQDKKVIALKVPFGTSLKDLVPTITFSKKATVTPATGVAQDFSKPVIYTVTAEDGTKQEYTIAVEVAKRAEKKIAEFKFASLSPAVLGTIDEEGKKINAVVPAGTDVTLLVPTLTISTGAQVSPSSNLKQNFTKPVVYTVTAEDGTKQEYTVTVEVAKRTEKKITEFKLASLNPAVLGTIDEEGKKINAIVPAGTDVTSLVPTLTISTGAQVIPSSNLKQDFTKPVVYTVTAEDGTKQEYTIAVKVAAVKSSEKKISDFKFASLSNATVTIDENAKTITIAAPAGSDVTALAPTITLSSGATVSPAPEVKQNFTKPVVYTVTAEDGTKQEYTVTVKVTAGMSSEKKISDFKFASLSNATVTIDENAKTITIAAPAGSDVTALAPTITLSSGATVSPAPEVKQDFTKPIVYTVTAEDGTKQEYTVTVKVAAVKSSEKKISDFKFASLSNATVTIDENAKTVTIAAPAGSDVTALAPTIMLSSGATVSPAPDVKQDFTKPVVYTVIAEDGTKQEYTVTLKVAAVKSGEKKITEFKFASVSNANVSINEDKKTISVAVPTGTDMKKLVPTITISENATVDPATGVVNDFSSPVTYTVTAQDGTKVSYAITVEVIKNAEAKITDFTFKSLGVSGVIDEGKKAIKLKVPFGTNVTALIPSITISNNAVITPSTGIKMDFSSPVTYKVVSETGVMAFYTVSVEVEKFETKITKVGSTKVEARDNLSIYGSFFVGKTKVELTGPSVVSLRITEETSTRLSVYIPDDVKEGDYTLSVTSNDITATYNSITVIPPTKPTIDRLSATKIVVGSELIIYGRNLNKDLNSKRKVDFYDSFRHFSVENFTINSEGTEARVIVPEDITNSKSVSCHVLIMYNNYGYESNSFPITVVSKPVISSVENTNIYIGDLLQVNGVSLFSEDAKIWFENKKTSSITMMSKEDIAEYYNAIRINTYKLVEGK